MAKKFVRTITDTDIKKEPFHTNKQNDIISDDKDVYIRNKEEYHCLTDNIKTIKSDNKEVKISRYKNNATINIDFPSSDISFLMVNSLPMFDLDEDQSKGYYDIYKKLREKPLDLQKVENIYQANTKFIKLQEDKDIYNVYLGSIASPVETERRFNLDTTALSSRFKKSFIINIINESNIYYGAPRYKRNILFSLGCIEDSLEYVYTPEGKQFFEYERDLKPGEIISIKIDMGKSDSFSNNGEYPIVGIGKEI